MLLSPKEVAQRLGVAPRTAQTLMKDGEIESCYIGAGEKLLRCQPAALDAYIARQFERYRRPLRGEAQQRRREEAPTIAA
jgi:excisionase family DNA binding protein